VSGGASPPASLARAASRDIPFDKLVLSQSNVRRVKAGVSIEKLAEDIARRTLLQSLTVRPVLDESGAETGMYEVPAGGRRYRALDAPRETWPALVAAVTDLDGDSTGILRTWLARDGSGKAPLATPRRALGRLLGSGVPSVEQRT
jgi:hypothetical protein